MTLVNDAEFQTFLEAAPDGLLLVDGSGHIVRTNRRLELLFGYARSELIGSSVELLLPERFRHAHRGHRTAYEDQPRPRPMGAGLDLYGRRRDGSEFPVDISLAPIETAAGRVTMAAVRDATERRRAESVARQLAANELRRRQALDLNDRVVQGLTAAEIAMELDDLERTRQLLASTLASARSLVNQLLVDADGRAPIRPGDLVRSEPATVRRDER